MKNWNTRNCQNYGYLYVTAVKPNETVKVMIDEVLRLTVEPILAADLKEIVNIFLTEHYMKLETNSAQAGVLADGEMLFGGWEQSLVFIEQIKKVTPDDILRVCETYLKNIHWGYIGDGAAVDPALLKSL